MVFAKQRSPCAQKCNRSRVVLVTKASAISCMVAAFMCVAPATAFSCSRSVALPQLRASFQSCSLRGRETSRQIHHAYGTKLLSMVEPVVVTLKIAVDSKGAVDDLGLTAKRFTCSESLDAVHRLRRDSDAVLVGVGTVARDDPSLTVRRVTPKDGDVQPSRVVIDPYLRIPPNSVLLRDGIHTVIACSEASSLPRDLFDALSVPTAAKVELFRLPDRGPGQSLELQLLLNALAERGMKEIMVEGGPETARRFLQSKLVDRAIVIQAPMEFEIEPVPSNIDSGTLEAAGLRKLAEHDRWGCDHVTLWATEQASWPTPDDVPSWP